jgi:hypothetical protein
MFGFKKKKQKAPAPVTEEDFKSKFNAVAFKKKKTKRQGPAMAAYEGLSNANLGIGIICLEPINLMSGFAGRLFVHLDNKDKKRDNKNYFEKTNARWMTDTGQRVQGTKFQQDIYRKSQDEIYRIRDLINKTTRTDFRKIGNEEIKEIKRIAGQFLYSAKITYRPEGGLQSKVEIIDRRKGDKPPTPGPLPV